MMDRERFPVDPWKLVEKKFDLDSAGLSETLFSIGNGYVGMRGNNAEGRKAHEHGTFINGLHETWQIRHAEQAYGFAEVGQTIVNAPDAKVMRLYVDDEPLSLDEAELMDYTRTLDFRSGELSRELVWFTPAGKKVRVKTTRMVSFVERHLALMTMEVTVEDADAPVTISCQMLNRQDGEDEYGGAPGRSGKSFDPRKTEKIADRVLIPGEYWQDGGRSVLSYRVANSGMTVAVAADHTIDTDNDYVHRTIIEPDIAKNVYRVQAKAGVPISITKFVSYHSSRGAPTRELINRCRRTLDRARSEGIEAQREKQRDWLDTYWRASDVQVDGQPEIQQAVRWNLLQLAQAAARADGLGIPAKGLTGSGYSGHYFWDTEIYVLPFLSYTTPLFARNALRMREQMLPAARKRAAQLNEDGALFPWRTISGEEASAYYAAGTAQYHINADVTYALARYVRATGDTEFLHRGAIDIAVETARLWATLGFWRIVDEETETFHIHGVTGPDEYTTVVNDNLFTNVMARFNLRYAARSVRELQQSDPAAFSLLAARLSLLESEIEEWERIGASMAIPYSDALGIHPQDSLFLDREVWDLANTPKDQMPLLLHFHPLVIYRFQVLKQADVVLALFLQGDEFTHEEKLADFEYYDPLTTGDSTLSGAVQSIIAAEIGYQDLALDYFHDSLFVDLADLHSNAADGVHVASAGGVWSSLVSGFGGMRDYDGKLSFDPRLPAEWTKLAFNLMWRGSKLVVRVRPNELSVTVVEGEPVEFSVRGTSYTVESGAELIVPLRDQGPRIPGKPTQRIHSRARRDDGTLMTASLPVVSNLVHEDDIDAT
ncbi:glycoside hydrolase family 65 protein [Labedella phragmitis]|uniref:Glycoside hydrolase family 65 protein n=1 Tax=Labedella phragmitis TaxID=2498849 RepID=A0A3S4D8A1_9MICO|nr:glycosyl hydrolase family 65 protein [Labedella phragmitis]RWZ46441.1 glycoside hydrolase family 65 protein [Labedella phragmitis]